MPATAALAALSGALNAPPRSRRALGAVVAALTLLAPWFSGAEAPLVRFSCAGVAALAVFRNLDIYRSEQAWGLCARVNHVAAAFDSRRVSRATAHFARPSWLRVGLFGVPATVSGWVLVRGGTPSNFHAHMLRWIWGALWAYSSIEALTALALAAFALLGAQLPKLHDNPILSRTLSELWGRRWNLSVRCLLHDHCFRPLARRAGLSLAVAGTFAASAVLHFWLTWAAAGYVLAASMAAFFLIQGALVLLESRLGVRRWPRATQHLWTASCVLLPLPLLLEPLLKVVFG